MNEPLIIIGMFIVTFGVRYPVLAAVSKVNLPVIIERGLKYVPPAVLMAIIAPAVLLPEGAQIDLSLGNAPLIASIFAMLIAVRTKNLLATILSGMGILWIWNLLVLS